MATGGGMREYGVRLKVGADGLENADKLGRALRELGVDTGELDKKAEALGAELAKLGGEQKLIDSFTRTKKASADAAQALADAQAAAQKLGREFAASEEPTKKQAAALQRAREEVVKAKAAYQEQGVALQNARKGLADAGISADGLAAAQVRVRQATEAAKSGVSDLTNQYRAAHSVAQLNADTAAKVADANRKAGDAAKDAADKQQAANRQVSTGLDGVGASLQKLGQLAVGGALGAGTVQVLRSAAETADAYNNLRARISLVTGEGQPLVDAMTAVEAIALRTGSSLETTGTLFARVMAAGKDLGLAQADALKLTETINQAVQVSGTGAAASDAAITQLIQGLGSGVLRGEEFNSVMEQAPRLAQALADGLGVTRGELRGLANDGQLSSEKVIQALKSQSAVLQTEFDKLPATVGRSVQNLNTAWSVFIGNLDKSTGFTKTVAQGINGIAGNLDELAGVATRAGAVLVAALAIQGAGALRTLATQALASGGAMAVLKTSIDQVPRVVNIAVAATGLEVGYQIGKLLYENFELARKLGVGVTEFFVGLVNDLQFLKEAAAAVFTDDTIGQAFDRFKQRAIEQRDIFAELYKEAEQLPEVQRAAADSAAAGLAKTGEAATTAGAAVAAGGAAGAAGIGAVGKAAETAEGALAALVKTGSQKLPEVGKGAAEQALQLAKLAEKGEQVARVLANQLPEAISKLSGSDLAQFRDALTGALKDSEKGAGFLELALAEVGKQAAKSLGVDLVGVSSTLSKEFVTQQENFSILVRSLPELKAAGVDAGGAVQQALSKMTDAARNETEFNALTSRVKALGTAGVLSGNQVTEALDKIRIKANEVKTGINGLEEAYKNLGIKSKGELEKVAAAHKQSWELVRNDSTATLEIQREAFTKYAEAAVAAYGSSATAALNAEGRALGLKVSVDETGKAIVEAMKKASKAVQDTQKQFNELGQEIDKTGQVINQLAGSLGGLSDAQRAAREKTFTDTPFKSGSSASSAPNAPAPSTFATGQAVNRPPEGEWVYSEVGYSIQGVDAKGNRLFGGWKYLGGGRSGLDTQGRDAFGQVPTLGGAGGAGTGGFNVGWPGAAAAPAQPPRSAAAVLDPSTPLIPGQSSIHNNFAGMFVVQHNMGGRIHTTYTASQQAAEDFLKDLERSQGTNGG